MRLIDADRLKDKLKTLPMMSNWGEMFMPLLIDEQPTAYDIDKVVEKLKERASQSCAVLFAAGIEEAISIIKAGEQE